ncbi:MAG: DnaD domain protein [Chloroflexi bacterium]|nr:DnaD domain protein [Chloroflexota bacterium]
MRPFDGFPPGTKSLPVPSPLLGSLLAEIDDVAELKCTLRFLWYTAQVSGSPKWVDESALLADSVLNEALGSQDAIHQAVAAAIERGTLVGANGRLLLATPENRRTTDATPVAAPPEPAREASTKQASNVYALYEVNIGLLTPMVADQLRDAEANYPLEWIEAAIREATERNVRNWRYVAAILERWSTEGRQQPGQDRQTGRGSSKSGEPGRHPQTASAAEYIRQRRPTG